MRAASEAVIGRLRAMRIVRGVVASAVGVALLAPVTAHAISEYKVKAAFLLNFGKFVEWPSAQGDLEICVLGEDPFGATLDDTLAGRKIGARPVRARRIDSAGAADGCAILFVSRRGNAPLDAVVSAVRGSPVLLVGEQDRFAKRGGMINFVEVDQKIRFEINETAAKKAGLKISSQLLKLATIVDGG
ncbi:MAG: YfiR family protein [Myxococcales bacterium]|nr:YfiR family protein [Myxococcales bacterium]